ncbi:MAG: type IV pilin [Methanocellales archaeon]
MNFRENASAISTVLGALLLVLITVVLAGLIAVYLLQITSIKKSVELYFVDVEANINGWINCTAVGRENVTLSNLKILINDELFTPNNTNMLINGKPYSQGSNDHIYGGARLAMKSSTSYSPGEIVRLTVSDVTSGLLLCEVEVKAR